MRVRISDAFEAHRDRQVKAARFARCFVGWWGTKFGLVLAFTVVVSIVSPFPSANLSNLFVFASVCTHCCVERRAVPRLRRRHENRAIRALHAQNNERNSLERSGMSSVERQN